MTLAILEDNMMVALPMTERARSLGFEVEVWESLEQAQERFLVAPPTHLVMAMRLASRALVDALDGQVRLAAYGPHVEGDRFQELRRWGIQDLWPNSRLDDKLPAWLQSGAS